ncbi:cation:proton antiporter [Emticicia sp. BO119]|uniref:cation:proton antiporter n=1 Tax=Emticicia sp. BO119 TaxID=2757768 RepID=UPI0015F041BD|nr:cation:proton antiporter [Emticicia sp. BO119]MBA4849717.1 sodium:proton antiporter [Emticicia sp. BO119]
MTNTIIIIICSLILIAYLFDISAKNTKIPGVVLLLSVGILAKIITNYSNFHVPNLEPFLPVIGTVGLILIVLEGALELEINAQKRKLFTSTVKSAFTGLVLFSTVLAIGLFYLTDKPFLTCLINAIPLGIISSAIAIPSVKNLDSHNREFVVYESSISDILGIIFFNFLVLHDFFGIGTFASFLFDIIIIMALSIIASIALGSMISKLNHHIKYIPIVTILILLYIFTKIYHLPSLVLVLIFGLFLNNVHLIKFDFVKKWINPESIKAEVNSFEHLIAEVTFVIRSFFFIMFGYYTDIEALLSLSDFVNALLILVFIFAGRYLIFTLLKIRIAPLLYIAPRGLITILLFLAIPETHQVLEVNKGLLTQIIFLTAFVMMFGLIRNKKTV